MGLKLSSVSHHFDGHLAVDDFNLSVGHGELVCLLGPSGCGKTTSLRLAAGLEDLQQGTISIGGRMVADGVSSLPPESRDIGFLFQDFALFPHLTIADNVAFGLEKMADAEKKARVLEVLSQVGMDTRGDSFPHMLSGGQQQRVALARALANRPNLVLLDEPFSGLDSALRSQVRDQTLHLLKKSGVSTLMVTHDPEEAMFMADKIALMREGRIVQFGPPADLYCRPVEEFVATFFGEVNDFESEVGSDGHIATPFGGLESAGLTIGTKVKVLIRPEALILSSDDSNSEVEVMASRLLGRSSLIHLKGGEGGHFHSRMPSNFLPKEGEKLGVKLDLTQTFVFPAK
ncbi:MAG: ABC transporter ATP-binding protein [Alphaproteobacteria bacterium]|nr:ABC transporter ATP-binding protein [Alphaproteobacteria bacterium]